MPSDYKAISERNKRELGTNLKSRRTQISLYADPTHFVYELLQNADDHQATEISFLLEPDRLVVEHNAEIKFQEKHVKGISFFEESTSETDLLKTGKFGLGFKSVLTFTATPRIASDDECFEIFDLHQVRSISKPQDFKIGTTRFELPFNHQRVKPAFIFQDHLKTPELACETIEAKFQSLEHCVLLFTRYLRKISFKSMKTDSVWSRVNKRDKTISIKSPTGDFRYRLYERAISLEGEQYPPLQLAMELDASGSPQPSTIPLVVTFPTSIATGMGLILNGPFRTTPAREMIGRTDDFNKMLLTEASELVKDLLRQEKLAKRLDFRLLELLPFDENKSDCPELFQPLAISIRDFIATEKLLPAAKGGFVEGKFARIARGQSLLDLFSNKQLTELERSSELLKWLPSSVSEQNTPNLYRALESIVRASPANRFTGRTSEAVLRPDRMFSWMTKEFLKSQPAKWICELYCVLGELGRGNSARKIAEQKPILRLSGNEQVALKKYDRTPSAYLPGPGTSSYTTVSPTAIRKAGARAYLTDLGFSTPDRAAEVLERIIPKYIKPSPQFQMSTHFGHLKKCIAAIGDGKDVSRIEQLLEEANIVFGENAATGDFEYRKPSECYFRDDYLSVYFEGHSRAWFVSHEYHENEKLEADIHKLFLRIGVGEGRPREEHAYESGQNVSVHSYHGWHERGLQGFHPEWEVAGLSNALANPSIERSAFIWNKLLPLWEHRIEGTVQKCSKQHFPSASTKTEEQISVAGKLLRTLAWIPNCDEEYKKASSFLSESELHPSLASNGTLLAILNKGSQRVREAAKTLAIENVSPEKISELRSREDQRHEFEEFLEYSPGASRQRRAKVGPQSQKRRRRTRDTRERKVREKKISSDDVYRYLGDFYHFDERWRCQICCYPMPFQKRNKEDCREKRELLSGNWASGRGYSLSMPIKEGDDKEEDEIVALPEEPKLYIVVCPTCNRIFQEYVASLDDEQDRLLKWILEEDSPKFQIRCSSLNEGESDRWIQFHRKHLDDIREIVSANLVKNDVSVDASLADATSNGKV